MYAKLTSRLFGILFMLIIQCSFGLTNPPYLASPEEINFHSEGNDMANISLTLDKKGRFALQMHILTNESKLHLRGKWKLENGYYILKFKRLKKTDLNLLFQSEQRRSNIKVLSEKTVSISSNSKSIRIWDIVCTKTVG